MATDKFKEGITERFKALVELLIRRGLAKNNTEVGALMNQPPQAISKMLMGDRIITLEQSATLSQNTNVNTHWLLTGQGSVFLEDKAGPQDVVTIVSQAIDNGFIPTAEGARVIEEITSLRKQLLEKERRITELQDQVISLTTSKKI